MRMIIRKTILSWNPFKRNKSSIIFTKHGYKMIRHEQNPYNLHQTAL